MTPLRVACLGPEGTVSQEALETAAQASGAHVDTLLTTTIHHAVEAVHSGEADFALVPLENSLEGGVSATLDELLAGAGMTPIVGEIVQPVRHRLIARPGARLEEITEVISLPFVADQCSSWLSANLPDAQMTPAASTADAVRTVAKGPMASAALGTALAARIYGCDVIADSVDGGGNSTRFVWLAAGHDGPGAPGTDPDAATKTSIVFWGSGAEEAGWLVDCLGEFGSRGVNLTRIESRPHRNGLGTYVFFADIDGDAASGPVSDALEGLSRRADSVVLLGSYPAAVAQPG